MPIFVFGEDNDSPRSNVNLSYATTNETLI